MRKQMSTQPGPLDCSHKMSWLDGREYVVSPHSKVVKAGGETSSRLGSDRHPWACPEWSLVAADLRCRCRGTLTAPYLRFLQPYNGHGPRTLDWNLPASSLWTLWGRSPFVTRGCLVPCRRPGSIPDLCPPGASSCPSQV